MIKLIKKIFNIKHLLLISKINKVQYGKSNDNMCVEIKTKENVESRRDRSSK